MEAYTKLKRKIERSHKLIQSIKDLGRVVINFSGGRDSMAVLLLTLDIIEDPIAWYMETTLDFPHTKSFVENICQKFGITFLSSHPEEYQGNLYYHVRRWGYFPTLQKPWCNGRLKIRPQRAKMRKLWGKDIIYKFNGIRRDESSRRQKMYSSSEPIVADPEHSGSFMVYPIINWTQEEVKYFLKMRQMGDHRGYKVCGVSGCAWCPFYQDSILLRVHRVFPHIYDEIVALEKEIGKPSLQGHRFLYNLLNQTFLEAYSNVRFV